MGAAEVVRLWPSKLGRYLPNSHEFGDGIKPLTYRSRSRVLGFFLSRNVTFAPGRAF